MYEYIPKIVCNLKVTSFSLFDTIIKFKESKLDNSKSLKMKQPQTCTGVKFSCWMDELYTHLYMAIPFWLQQHLKLNKILNSQPCLTTLMDAPMGH